MADASFKMIKIDPEVHAVLSEVAERRHWTIKYLTSEALLQWCRRQPEYREAKKSA